MALTGAVISSAYKAMRMTVQFSRILLYSSLVVVLFSWLRMILMRQLLTASLLYS